MSLFDDDYRQNYTDPDILYRIWDCPWDGDSRPVPRSYKLWYKYYSTGQKLRHARGKHTYHQRLLGYSPDEQMRLFDTEIDQRFQRICFHCAWCGRTTGKDEIDIHYYRT